MPDSADTERLADALVRHLRATPMSKAADLCRVLAISQPTFSRLVGALPDAVLAVGRARATRYLARREVLGLPRHLPLFEVGPDGAVRHFGALHPVHPRGYWFESAVDGARSRHYDDLPWFMHDLRPAGFLGRLIPRLLGDFAHLGDVREWSGDDVLRYLSRHGQNQVGNLLVGEGALQGYLAWLAQPGDLIATEARAARYPEMAADVLGASVPGSSAAGEQPKFLATLAPGPTPVLVKFSPPLGSPQARRAADLLVAEHLALETLAAHGQPASRSRVLEAGGRVFLEVDRFDRLRPRGRRGVVSLEAADAEFVAGHGGWRELTEGLVTARVATPEVFEAVRWLASFGELIGNTHMHRGNLSFFFEGGAMTGLCPAYDMTPMRYAVRQHEFTSAPLSAPMPRAADADVWASACAAAAAFWEAVSEDTRISEVFRAIACANREVVTSVRDLAALLPKAAARPGPGAPRRRATRQ